MATRQVVAWLLVAGVLGGSLGGCAHSTAPEQGDVRRLGTVSGAPLGTPPASATADPLNEAPHHPSGPAETARMIVAAERAIAERTSTADTVAAAGRVQQLAYRSLGAHPTWDARVHARLPKDLGAVVAAAVASRRAFRSMHTTLSDTLPAWRIVGPASIEVLRAAYRTAQRRTGVDWEYLAAINLVETDLGRIRGTSVAGAQGPMQFLPSTWERWGRGDIDDPRDAILAAGRFLAGHGFNRPGGIPAALFGYNNSSAYVRGVTLIAQQLRREPRAFAGYHAWEVYYLTSRGDVLLPEGYAANAPIPVEDWLAEHPQR